MNLPVTTFLAIFGIGRLTRFLTRFRAEAEAAIAKKRIEVSAVLERLLAQETTQGDLDAALAIRSKIDELSKPKARQSTSETEKSVPASGTFQDWLETVSLHDQDGFWDVHEEKVVQFQKSGDKKEFERTINDAGQEVSFKALDTVFTFSFNEDRTAGSRKAKSKKYPDRPFTVKPRK